jgi:two-component system sensor histidine kinase YesM
MKKLLQRLIKAFEFSKLKYRFIFFFIIVSMIPTLLLGISSSLISKGLILEREEKDAMSNITKIKEQINEVMSERETTALKFYIDQSVQQLFSEQKNSIDDKFEIMKLLFSREQMKGNHSIFLSDEYGNIYSNARAVSSSSKQMNYQYNKLLQKNNIDYKWVGLSKVQGEFVLPYVRAIKSFNLERNLGLVIINLKESTISNIYKSLVREKSGDIFILDENGYILSNLNKTLLEQPFIRISKIGTINSFKKSYTQATIGNQKYLLVQVTDSKTQWKYLNLVPLDFVLEGNTSMTLTTLLICILSILLALFIGITVALRITVPVNDLILFMNEVEGGNLDLEYNIDRKDEIGKLANYFNKMIKRLKVSINEIYNVQRAKRDAELKALVFQINPHFLYNTLSSIIWLAHNGKNEKVIEMADTLSKLFRISISRGKEIIKIGKELEHVQSYVKIQEIRYNDMFVCVFDIDDDILDYYTPKLILQPLVENAIYHGIKSLEDQKGIIKIEGKRVDDKIIFNVIDNGNALTEEQANHLNEVLKNSLEEANFGIGIKNVNNRIKLYYGPEYELSFSRVNGRTIAALTLPVVETEP